ncbi:PAS domain S-box protein [Aromatoleum toluolicum]|uniref:histidine kinase n=1 Tax=Aromatoleum toluolicum TaxID=90060 RepID=A0ABX1NF86_9RHOO|nr:PAS domain-containing sensor histidine kinase [Aromatoleum toluolicum]NMF97870.1 PAS domain S-box protein [Aromatoleum toluolicum]
MIEVLQALGDGNPAISLAPLFDAMLEGVVVRDAHGRVVGCNRMARRILGLPSGDLLAGGLLAPMPDYLREDDSILRLDEHPANLTLSSGEALHGVVLGVVRAAGEICWINLNSQPLRDTDGALVGVVETFADITPMKSAQAALRAAEAHNRTLAAAIAQAGCAVVVTDRHGRIEYVNPACCRAYGYAEEELLGAKPSIFKSGETSAEVYAELWQTILAGRVWCGELSNRSRDGCLIRESVSVAPLRDEAGVVRHFVAVKEDITQMRAEERRRHELFERVARLERMELVATLSSGIAHDFNNVLVAILGYSELADAHLKVDGRLPRVEGYIDEIRIAGNRARGLIQQLLDFSRSGTAQPRLTQLESVGREAVGLLRATLPDSVAVIDEIERDLPALSVDPAHVYQIIMNLLVNARDAVNGRGTIRVGARRVLAADCPVCASCRREFDGEFIVLSVSDNGCGIPLSNRSRLFEPFFTTKEPGRGTGMGLPVVHGMTHLYDGHVRIESEPGGGTRVEVLLPVVLTQVPGIDSPTALGA